MIHNQKLKQFRRKRADNIQPESKLFFNEYSHEIFERITQDVFNASLAKW